MATDGNYMPVVAHPATLVASVTAWAAQRYIAKSLTDAAWDDTAKSMPSPCGSVAYTRSFSAP
jgi:hypothetical protein